MTTMTVQTSRTRPYTRADLDDMPDDGRRYEILDGMLLVSACPSLVHQVVLGNLHLLLRQACPPALHVLFAPFSVVLAEDTVLEPDLLVAPRAQFTAKDLPGAPLLAVEVLSPSTRRYDRTLKLDRYREAGLQAYWLVDPLEPAVQVFALTDGVLVEQAHVGAGGRVEVTLPYPLGFAVADLLL